MPDSPASEKSLPFQLEKLEAIAEDRCRSREERLRAIGRIVGLGRKAPMAGLYTLTRIRSVTRGSEIHRATQAAIGALKRFADARQHLQPTGNHHWYLKPRHEHMSHLIERIGSKKDDVFTRAVLLVELHTLRQTDPEWVRGFLAFMQETEPYPVGTLAASLLKEGDQHD